MNIGIGDAINLAWKLAAVLAGHAPDKLLGSYEAERIGFARRLVATTDRVFSFVTAEGWIADIIRTRVAPVLIPTAMAFEAAREYLFRTVSQITLNYRDGPLSVGAAGHVHGGDRLPWVPLDGTDNFETRRCMSLTGDRRTRRPASRVTPSICSGRIRMWRSPMRPVLQSRWSATSVIRKFSRRRDKAPNVLGRTRSSSKKPDEGRTPKTEGPLARNR
jgi:hypothetical protein